MNIREIARLSGVSIATVSRVINTPQLVQEQTRARGGGHTRGAVRAGPRRRAPRPPPGDAVSVQRGGLQFL